MTFDGPSFPISVIMMHRWMDIRHQTVCYESPEADRISWALLARSQASSLHWLTTDDSFMMSLSNCKQWQKHHVNRVSKILQTFGYLPHWAVLYICLIKISSHATLVIVIKYNLTAPANTTTMLTHLYAVVQSQSQHDHMLTGCGMTEGPTEIQ